MLESFTNNTIEDIDIKNVCLFNNSIRDSVNLKDLIQIMEERFCNGSVDIQIKATKEKVEFCSAGGLYQILYSFIEYIGLFLSGQDTDKPQIIVEIYSDDKLSIKYTGKIIENEEELNKNLVLYNKKVLNP